MEEMEVLVVVLNLMVVLDLLMDHLVEVIIQTPLHLVGAILVELVKVETLGQVVEEAVLVVVEPMQVVKVLAVLVGLEVLAHHAAQDNQLHREALLARRRLMSRWQGRPVHLESQEVQQGLFVRMVLSVQLDPPVPSPRFAAHSL